MEIKDRTKHLAPGKGKTLWVAGDLVTLKVVDEDTDGVFAFGEDISLPGGGPPPHIHHHEDEIFWLVEGEYEFLVGERTIRASAGSWSTARGTSLIPSRTWGPHPPGCSRLPSPPVLRSSWRKRERWPPTNPSRPLARRRSRGSSRPHRSTALRY